MTKLDKLRDDLASGLLESKDGDIYFYDQQTRFKQGFNAARDVLLPEVSRLVEHIRLQCYCHQLHPDIGGKCDGCYALARWEKFIGEGK